MLSKVLTFVKHPVVLVALTVIAVEFIDSRSGTVRSTLASVPFIGPWATNQSKAA